MVIQWKILSPLREVSGMFILKYFLWPDFSLHRFFLLNLFWYFWNPQETLNDGTGQLITEVRAKTLKDEQILSFYMFLASFFKTYLDPYLWFILFWKSRKPTELVQTLTHILKCKKLPPKWIDELIPDSLTDTTL